MGSLVTWATPLDPVPTVAWAGGGRTNYTPSDVQRSSALHFANKIRTLTKTGYLQILPWIDENTCEPWYARKAYRGMLADSHVKAAVLSKVFSVASQDWQVIPAVKGDPRAAYIADAYASCLEQVEGGIPELVVSLALPALVDKIAVADPVWEISETLTPDVGGRPLHGIKSFKVKDCDYYDLLWDDMRDVKGVAGRDVNGQWQVYDPSLFIIFRVLSLYDIPMSDLRAAYSYYWTKDTARKLRMTGIEKFALPYFKAELEDASLFDAAVSALQEAQGNRFAVVPKGVALDAITIASGSNDVFHNAEADFNEGIVIALTGATLQMLTGQVPSSRGDSKVQRATAELFSWYLSARFQTTANQQLAPQFVKLNFGGERRYPKLAMGGINADDMLKELQIDRGLAEGLGLYQDGEAVAERYGRRIASDPSKALRPPAVASSGLIPGLPGGDGATLPAGAGADTGSAAASGNVQDTGLNGAQLSSLQAIITAVAQKQMPAANARALILSGFPLIASALVDKMLAGLESFTPAANPAAPPTVPAVAKAGDATTERIVAADKPTITKNEALLAGPDSAEIERLLSRAQRLGVYTLADLTASAVARLGTKILSASRLFNAEERQELADSLAAVNGTADLLGRAGVRDRLAEAVKRRGGRSAFSDEVTTWRFVDGPVKPLPPAAALQFFLARYPALVVKGSPWAEQLRKQAFTLAVATDETLLQSVKDVVTQSLASGTSAAEATGDIQGILDGAGVSPKNPQYSEMVYRTNMGESYRAGADAEAQDPDIAGVFPVWRYVGIRDGRQGKDHEPKFGLYFPNRASFAEVRGDRPYNCRCLRRDVDKWEWKQLQNAGADVETSW